MQAVMVSGSVVHMSNNRDKAARAMDLHLRLLYPKCDRTRAVETFKAGTPVVVGCISGLVI